MTRLDALLRQLFTSRNPAHNTLALQVLDPKILTEQHDITSGGEQITKVTFDYGKLIAGVTPRPVEDSDPPSQDESNLHGQAVGQNNTGGDTGS